MLSPTLCHLLYVINITVVHSNDLTHVLNPESEKEMALEKLEVSIIQHQMNLKKSKSDMNKILSEKEGECDQIRLSTQKSVNEIQLKLECEIRSRSEAVKEKKSQGYKDTQGLKIGHIFVRNGLGGSCIPEKDKKLPSQMLRLNS